ncbi:MAG: DUF2017 domain-containing protein [Propionibacteriaceae bacterium]|jgi:hypothetical protein|nr:DUF2017 domain-containing protein [Propionibacteriaceae bacterium]
MKAFSRKGSVIRARMSEFERTILASLVQQVAGLLEGDAAAAPSDPFAMWQAEMGAVDLDFDDPVLARLFPAAFADDEQASAEFRRLTAGRQRQERLSNAGRVLDDIENSDEDIVEIDAADCDAWLKTLTSVRLALAVRLGIEVAEDTSELDDLPEDDPRSFVYSVYEWLAYVCESLLGLGGQR